MYYHFVASVYHFQEVLDPDNGYCVDNTVRLLARVSADAPHGIKYVQFVLPGVFKCTVVKIERINFEVEEALQAVKLMYLTCVCLFLLHVQYMCVHVFCLPCLVHVHIQLGIN